MYYRHFCYNPAVAFLWDITLHKWKKNKGSGQNKIWFVIENSANIFKLVDEIVYAKFCVMRTALSYLSVRLS